MGVGDLPHQPRLAHAGLADQGHELAMPRGGAAERLAKLLDLGLAPDEAGEPPGGGGLEPRTQRARPEHLVDLDGRLQTLDRHRSEGLDGDEALDEAERVRGQEGGAGAGELLHAGREVRGLSHRRVVHAEIAPDGPHDDLPRVEPDANLRPDPEGPPNLFGIASDRPLHVEGRVARPHRVVLVGERRAEERHDAVAHHLVDRALVAVDGLYHALEDGVEELPGLLGVPVGQQLHGPLEVSEKYRDLLALAFEGGLGGEDLLGEVLRGVGLRGVESLSGSRRGR